jgi:hypothetical protein
MPTGDWIHYERPASVALEGLPRRATSAGLAPGACSNRGTLETLAAMRNHGERCVPWPVRACPRAGCDNLPHALCFDESDAVRARDFEFFEVGRSRRGLALGRHAR